MKNPMELSKQIEKSIRIICDKERISLHEPEFSGKELIYLKDCVDSTFVSSVGKYVDRFESDLCNFTGSKYSVALVNGTAALHIALVVAGVEPDDEVLIPSLTFVATANAVRYCNASPHFIDCQINQPNIDCDKLDQWLSDVTQIKKGNCFNKITGRRIRALIPMHAYGHPCDLDALVSIASKYKLILIEDAAESIGSFYKGRHTGTLGEMGVLSFNGNKTITTGGGGAILTNNKKLALRAKHISTTAKKSHPYKFDHDEIGYNYRMPNINAALGCAQLEQLPGFIKSKKLLYEKYQEIFSKINQVSLLKEPENTSSNYWLQTLILDSGLEGDIYKILEHCNSKGIMVRPTWTPMHCLPMFRDCPSMPMSNTDSLSGRIINIPSSPGLA